MEQLMPDLEDGVQIWSDRGELLYYNSATINHFGPIDDRDPEDCSVLLQRCLDENEQLLQEESFPVYAVLASGEVCHSSIIKVTSKDNTWLRLTAYPIAVPDSDTVGVISFSHEVSGLIEKGLQLEQRAHYDSLTGLPNRLLLSDRLSQAIAHEERSGNIIFVCLMDLDGFKQINDTLGHEAGDLLLKETAQRLIHHLRPQDTAVRLGGDEFVLLIEGLEKEETGLIIVQRILNAIAAPYTLMGRQCRVTASIGVTIYPKDTRVADQLLRHADQAMYKAKEGGKNSYHLYDPTIASLVKANQSAIKSIEKAIYKNQMRLYYQPKVDCAQEKVTGVEALLRWEHPVLGIRSPAEFLPLIEHHDLIIKLGEWVIVQALEQIKAWKRHGLDLQVSVNIAARHLLRGNIDTFFETLIKRYSADIVQHLEIEILETAALEDINAVSNLISNFQPYGISFALDDFGTGYSSLAHLKHLPADTLKVDVSFVRDIHSDPSDLGIIQGIIGLASAFQRKVVAEGVENIEQALMLIELGCSVIQGHGIARPMTAESILDWVKNFEPDPRWRIPHSHYPQRADFELLLMMASHRNWIQCIEKQVNTPELAPKYRPHSFEQCRITKWFAGSGRQNLGNLQSFDLVQKLHKKIHQLGDDLVEYSIQGQLDACGELHQELIHTSKSLLNAFENLRHELSNRDAPKKALSKKS